MRSKTGVLVAIKLFQLVGSTVCLTLHIYAYTTGLDVPHITVFCGTYMGFGLVNVAFLVSAVMGKPAAEELDMAFGAIGSVLFYACGVLSMYQVRQKQYAEQERTNSLEIPNAYEMDPRFFLVTRAQAISSVVTALTFVYDACLKFDMWKYDWDVKRNKLKEDAFDPPDLRLFCLRPCDTWYRNYKRKKEQREAENPPTLIVPTPPTISVQKPTQRLRSASPTGDSRRRTRSVGRIPDTIDFARRSTSLIEISIPEENDLSKEMQRSWISPEKEASAAEGYYKQRPPSPGTPPPLSPPPLPESSPSRSPTPAAPTLRAAPARGGAKSPVGPTFSLQPASPGGEQGPAQRTLTFPSSSSPVPLPSAKAPQPFRKQSFDLLDVVVDAATSVNPLSSTSASAKKTEGSKEEKLTKRNLPRRRRV